MSNVHLMALSSLLARDPEAGLLHTRHLQVLAHLCVAASPMNGVTIAAVLDISPSQLSRLLAKLEARGFVTRTDPRYRPMLFAPTPQGQALDQRVRAHIDACRTTTSRAA